jgi:hypothetical protein
LKRLSEHEETAKDAADHDNSISTLSEIALTIGASPRDSCNHCYMTRALEISKEVEGQVLEAPPSLVPF